MNILFISKDGSSLGLAERVRNEGHNVYFSTPVSMRIGEGIVDTPSTTAPILKDSGYSIATNIDALLKDTDTDLVVFDGVGMGRVADYIRDEPIPVFGASRWADYAQLDSSYTKELMKSVGIQPLPKSVSGIMVNCELWWDGIEASTYSMSIVDERLMNEDIGPIVGCAGNVVHILSSNCRLVEEGIGKMTRLLKKTNYRGPISLRSLCTKTSLYGLSFTVSLGHSTPPLIEIYKGSIIKLLFGVATCSQDFGEFTSDCSISIQLSLPPYPHIFAPSNSCEGVPILGVNSYNLKHIWWEEVRKYGKEYEVAGTSGRIGRVVARGRTIDECRRRVYRTISNLSISDLQYRTDIGIRAVRAEKQLGSWKYI